MKNIAIVLAGLFFVAVSCTSKESKSEEEWKEMEAFHDLMAAAYHPVYDSSNLAPARDLADDMAASAKAWSVASLPDRVNNEEVRNTLLTLRDSSASFNSAVAANLPDSVIKVKITDLHHIFHKLHSSWEGHAHEQKKH